MRNLTSAAGGLLMLGLTVAVVAIVWQRASRSRFATGGYP